MSGGAGDNKDIEKGLEAVVRGIFIGASLAVFGSWLDVIPMDMGRAVALGGIIGAAASLTMRRRRDKLGK